MLVWAELEHVDEASGIDVLERVKAGTHPEHLASTALFAEDRGDAHVLVLGVPDPAAAFAVANEVSTVLEHHGRPAAHLAMLAAVQRVGSITPPLDDAILTVRLPVPPGREHEWNLWYAATHMTGLLATVGPTITSGTRFAPLGGTTDYVVAYDFTSRAAMRDWVDGQGIAGKRSGYREKWGVRNTMRALVRVS